MHCNNAAARRRADKPHNQPAYLCAIDFKPCLFTVIWRRLGIDIGLNTRVPPTAPFHLAHTTENFLYFMHVAQRNINVCANGIPVNGNKFGSAIAAFLSQKHLPQQPSVHNGALAEIDNLYIILEDIQRVLSALVRVRRVYFVLQAVYVGRLSARHIVFQGPPRKLAPQPENRQTNYRPAHKQYKKRWYKPQRNHRAVLRYKRVYKAVRKPEQHKRRNRKHIPRIWRFKRRRALSLVSVVHCFAVIYAVLPPPQFLGRVVHYKIFVTSVALFRHILK